MKCYRKSNPTLLHWATAFFQKRLCGFLKDVPHVFWVHFLHRKTYSLKYWTRRPSVCQSVCLSVRESVGPSIHPCFSIIVNSIFFNWGSATFAERSINSLIFMFLKKKYSTYFFKWGQLSTLFAERYANVTSFYSLNDMISKSIMFPIEVVIKFSHNSIGSSILITHERVATVRTEIHGHNIHDDINKLY